LCIVWLLLKLAALSMGSKTASQDRSVPIEKLQ